MQDYEKIVTPGYVVGHRVKAPMDPLFAPAAVSYVSGGILPVLAISGAASVRFSPPPFFDLALTVDSTPYEKAAADWAEGAD